MGETGYIYAIVCAVMNSLQMIVIGVCLERMLTGRNERISKRKRMILWAAVSILLQDFKCLVSMPVIYFSVGTPILMMLCDGLFLYYCYSDKGKVKILHITMLTILNVWPDIIYTALSKVEVELWDFPFASRSVAEGCVIVTVFSITFQMIYTLFVQMRQKKKRVQTSPMWIAEMLLFLLLFVAVQVAANSGEQMNSYFIFNCIFVAIVFSVIMFLCSQSEKQEAQEEKREVQEEVLRLQQAMELEKFHYEQIEARREEMAKIRHDYNNVITSVMLLIENGKTEEAKKIMKDLSERIGRTEEL